MPCSATPPAGHGRGARRRPIVQGDARETAPALMEVGAKKDPQDKEMRKKWRRKGTDVAAQVANWALRTWRPLGSSFVMPGS